MEIIAQNYPKYEVRIEIWAYLIMILSKNYKFK